MSRPLGLLALLVATASSFAFASADQWIEISSPHFTVITDSSDKQGRHTLDQFERMRWMFQTLFPASKVDPPLPIVVVAVRSRQQFQMFEPAAYLAKGQMNLAGYFLGTGDKNYVLLRFDTDEDHPYSTIYHEYTHLQFSDSMGWMPLWLSEGLAEFIQNTEIRNKEVLVGQPSKDDILYLRQHQLLPLATLFKVDHNSPYYHDEQKGSVFYSESWALTHYLEISDREKGTHQLQDYVSMVSQHQDPVESAEKAFGDLKRLQATLEDYIRSSSYRQFILNSAAAPIDESTYVSKPMPQVQVDALRADFLVYMQREQEAKALLDSVLRADPGNAQAYETKGYLAFRDGDTDSARKWYEQAVKLDSRSFLANYYYAALSIDHGDTSNDAQIESSLRAAIRLNPQFAPAYDQLAAQLAMHHKNLDEAHALNMRAIQLDPRSLTYRLNSASVLMTMSRYDDAAAVLRGSVHVATNSVEAATVQSRLKEVECFRALGAKPSAMITAPPSGVVDIRAAEEVVNVVPPPKHPTEPADGPKHIAIGVMRKVQCSYPAVLEFEVETAKRTISLYSNNYLMIDLTALGFTPKGSLDPCINFEGMKAQVQYAEGSDKTVEGQVIAVELRK
jgi:tetratricopeptide (TPR) repeat protein